MFSIEGIVAIAVSLASIAVFLITMRINGKANTAAIEKLEVKGEKVDDRFEKLIASQNERFNKVDDHFDKLLEYVNDRFDKLILSQNDRFEKLIVSQNDRFAKIDDRFEKNLDILREQSSEIAHLSGILEQELSITRLGNTRTRSSEHKRERELESV